MGQIFVAVKTLPLGIYHYRYIVDGYFTYAPEFPWAWDDSGYVYNILDLQVNSMVEKSHFYNLYLLQENTVLIYDIHIFM